MDNEQPLPRYENPLDEEWRKMWTSITCPDCGHDAHEGYDLICVTPDCPICKNVQCRKAH